MDVVARMPRGTMGGISLDYCHSGRTVMVAEDPAEPPWIQGEVNFTEILLAAKFRLAIVWSQICSTSSQIVVNLPSDSR